MNWILNKIFIIPFIYFISILPFRFIYVLSDLICFVLYYLIQFRRVEVRRNISNAFPAKDKNEISQIERKFYSHFTDLFLESFKMLTISPTSLKNRVRLRPSGAISY